MTGVSSLNNVVATIFVLRTLIVTGGLFPLVVMASPFVVGILLSILNTITRGYGFFSILGTMAVTLAGRAFIAAYAPTSKHRDEAFRKSSVVLPLLAFGTFQAMLHLILVPLSIATGVRPFLMSTPSIPYADAFRVSISMFLLSLTIVLRYIGVVSVMRCSAFPVISSPFIAALRSLWVKCTSFDALIAIIAAPSDTPGVLIDTPFKSNKRMGRRYQTPTIANATLLLATSLLLAGAAAWVLNSHGKSVSPNQSESVFNASWLAVLSHLLMTCFDGKSHELNPLRYHRTNLRLLMSHSQLETYLYSTVLAALMAPLSLHFLADTSFLDIPWNLVVRTTIVAIAISVYLSVVDLTARNFLCASGFNLPKLVCEVTSEINPTLTMEVIVTSLVFHDDERFQSIMKPTANIGAVVLEEEELSRNNDDADKMSVLLTKKSDDLGLEDDVLRVLILESIGGKDPDSVANLGAAGRHEKTVKSLVPGVATGRPEPLAVPMIRALCAYAAGLGVALQRLGHAQNPKQPHPTATFEVWALPPGALICSERALIGATRCVVYSITSLGPDAMDWRGTELSMFVPVVLVTAFQLRCGIQAYGKDVLAKTGKATFANHLSRVERTCDDCALFLLKSLQCMESRTVELTIHLRNCRTWLETLLDQGTTPGTTQPPILIRENDRPLAIYNKGGFALKYY